MDLFTVYLEPLERALQAALAPPPDAPELLYGMLHYHLGWADADFRPAWYDAGKRLRPIFLLLSCQAQGGEWRAALPAAVAVELLHNFSLIHDDIEDRDATRRGRATLWAFWGEAQAINAGDALFALAYKALGGLQATTSPVLTLAALERFTQTTLDLTAGQCQDIAFERASAVAEEMYLTMVAGKTAALLALCCELGGLVAAAPEQQVRALREFGHALGMAFQIEDDILGLWGTPKHTGKPVGSDLQRGKKTLPILHGLNHSPALRALLEVEPLDTAAVAEALMLLEAGDSRAYAEAQARHYHQQALAALERACGSGEAQEALLTLAQRLLGRDK